MEWQLPQYDEDDVATTGTRSRTATMTTTTAIPAATSQRDLRGLSSPTRCGLRLWLRLLDFAVTHEASPSEL